MWFSRNVKRREPVGTCFTARHNFATFFEYSPCRTRKWGYHRQGSCQAGLGADIAQDGNQIFVGAVGSWYWQGQVFSQKLVPLKDQFKTAEGSPSDDDSYLGYSVATGDFDGDGAATDVAVGMPRGSNLTGKVVLYNSQLTNLNNLTGDQIGAYFGYSVASGDFNGDGRDDVVIGAPMWTNYEKMGIYESGKVYVAYQSSDHHFRKYNWIEGQNHKARFGLSVACAGNLNLDGRSPTNPKGIEDLIVGAPYDGPEYRGAIYVFLGSTNGISQTPAQVVTASDIDPTIKTFGWSLSAGMDLDQNEYPDLLIGAYDSSKAVYLKSSPVVHLDTKVNFRVPSKQINLDEKRCTLSDGTKVPCVDVDVSMRYDGVGVPDSIALELQYLLDAKKDKTTKRLFFLKYEGRSELNRTVEVRRGQEWKDRFSAHLPASGIHDKLTSIDVQVRSSMSSRAHPVQRRSLSPVLGHNDRLATDSLSIQKNCGPDSVCIPDLSVSVSHDPAYVIGSGEKLEITADIRNDGEDAFNAMLYLQIPREVNYINANSSSSYVSVLCSPPNEANKRTLQCDVGNPLPAKTYVTVRIFFQPIEEDQDQFLAEYKFMMAVNSSNPEALTDRNNNQQEIQIPVKVTSDWRVSGTSKNAQVAYNLTAPLPDKYVIEDQIGEEIFHIYEIKNRGPSTIQEAEVYILWPSFDGNSNHLLYLLGVQYDPSENVTCQSIANINPLYVKTIGSAGYAEMLSQVEASGGHGYSYGRRESSYSRSSASGSQIGRKQSGSYSSTSQRQFSSSGGARSSEGAASSGSAGGRRYGQSSYEYEANYNSVASPGAAEDSRSDFTSSVSRSSSSSSGSRFGSVSRVAEGAEETRLFDGDEEGNADEDVFRSRSFSSHSTKSDLEKAGSSATRYGSGESASSYDYEKKYDTRYESLGRDGSSGSSSLGSTVASGWKLLENGTYIRIYDTRTTAKSRSNETEMGSGRRTQDAAQSSGIDIQKSGHYDSLNTIFGAARGPGNYHGTIKKSELEQDAGGQVFSTSSGETKKQVETTRYQGPSYEYGTTSYGYGQSGYGSGRYDSSSSAGSGRYDSSSSAGSGRYDSSLSAGLGRYDSSSSTGSGRFDSSSSTGSSHSVGSDRYESSSSVGSGRFDLTSSNGPNRQEPPSSSGSGRFDSSSLIGSGHYESSSSAGSNRYEPPSSSGSGRYESSARYEPSSSGLGRYESSSSVTHEEGSYYDLQNRGKYGGGSSSSLGSSISGSTRRYGTGATQYDSSSTNTGESYYGGSLGDNRDSSRILDHESSRYDESSVNQGNRDSRRWYGGETEASHTESSAYNVRTSSGSGGSPGRHSGERESHYELSSSNMGGSSSRGSMGGSVTYEEGSYYDLQNRGQFKGGSSTASTDCKYIWSDANNRWECDRGSHHRDQDKGYGSTDSGWVTKPDGTRVRTQSSWSSWSSSAPMGESDIDGGRQHIQGQGNRRNGAASSETNSDSRYFDTGHIGNAEGDAGGIQLGQADSGWIQLSNGTHVRRKSSWSSSKSRTESSYGSSHHDSDDIDELGEHYARGKVLHQDNSGGQEFGDHGQNSTGWIEHPDGTLVRKSSSWASWSSSSLSTDDSDPSHLEIIRRRLKSKTNQLLQASEDRSNLVADALPSNVEPGFEASYKKRLEEQSHHTLKRRTKRSSLRAFEKEIHCPSNKCTLMRCTIGPLIKDNSVVFKIRSRLFTETQIRNYAERVTVSSKLVARVTRLPYLADPMSLDYQSHQVTTEVFPSEMGEAPVDWWVWLLAALGGILLLALICYCLYKCGFFKRKRPDSSPERQPLNGYH